MTTGEALVSLIMLCPRSGGQKLRLENPGNNEAIAIDDDYQIEYICKRPPYKVL